MIMLIQVLLSAVDCEYNIFLLNIKYGRRKSVTITSERERQVLYVENCVRIVEKCFPEKREKINKI